MPRLNLMIDLERCIGCKSCEAACKQVNGLGPHEYRTRVQWLGDPDVPDLDFLTVTCQQCERPACLRACPVSPKALEKDPDTGVVSVDESRCTGCGECVAACPYGAMGYDPVEHHAVKCDLCAPRRAEGGGPACVSVCPTEALSFGRHDDLLARARDAGRHVRDHDHFLQGPGTIILDRMGRPEHGRDTLAGRVVPKAQDDPGRRGVLDGAAVATPYRVPAAERRADRIERGGCNICFNGCPVKYHLRGDEVIGILGNDDDPIFAGRVCPKSQMSLQMYAGNQRLTRPLKRVGARGEGRFEPVSWEHALDDIAARLRGVRERHGPEALAIFLGTRTGVLTIMGYARLFQQLWGTPNMLTTQILCDEGKVQALERVQGSTNLANIYTREDIGSADLHVYIGDNQAETRPVNFGLVNGWRLERGARMVVVDPRLTATASKADRWLAIRPGTDMALGLALIGHLFTSGLHDQAFCRDWVLGWEHWRDFIAAEGYTPEWAAPITGLAAADIRWLAETIAAADGCMLYLSRGVNQHANSTQCNRVFMFLAAITGNWGRPGGGFSNVASEPDWGPLPVPETRRKVPERGPVGPSVTDWANAALQAEPYPLRALITGNNPVGQWPDSERTQQALAAMDLVVHIELFRNATSEWADYVLPAASGIEKGGVSRLAEDRRIVWNDRMIPPPGEARSDHWIWVELGRRLGFGDVLEERYKDPAVFWDEVFRQATPDLRGVTVERLREQPGRWLRTPLREEGAPEAGTLYLEGTAFPGDPEGRRFPTPSGRLEFWSEAQEQAFAARGLSALPFFYGDAEQGSPMPWFAAEGAGGVGGLRRSARHPGAADAAAGFDTELVTGRPPAPQFHSWTHYFWQAQEMWPDLYCQLHPDKASAIGVGDGDRVRLETPDGGSLEARAWVTRGIRPESVFVPIGWGEGQPWHPWGSVNRLTRGHGDPFSGQPNLKLHRCRVRRA
ncbi:molybdopterin-dependent oxidoreductase [Spiribacter halobius]|uniref:Oxidoreductase n=1 Tax=Sediminicurvatus halobius TaxID=2182432 RepID=A0A2U2N6G0_9GAMM|nr:molybdopterin-dependent oxidoreductase [Spiribacter halobius]PWG64539.1 oxidoreductase [Spiribacter halobius]UEX79138.1 molybdopterin-dependent oxidoreductase [Spiribacter halobius]